MHAATDLDVLEATRQERLDLCSDLDTLDHREWHTRSLCADWTVKDVVAHLTTATTTTVRDMAIGMVRARGDFDRMERDRARSIAERSTPQDLVAALRTTAGSSSRAPLTSIFDPLLDVLVHGQDIARPLGRQRPMPLERAVPALDHAVNSRWYGTRRRLAGVRVEATDADWRWGDADLVVAGPVADLLLVATGRPAGLAGLRGSGLTMLAERLPRQSPARDQSTPPASRPGGVS